MAHLNPCVRLWLAVHFHFPGRDAERGQLPLTIIDVSSEGCRCQSDEKLYVGEVFDLSFYLLPEQTPIHVEGGVVRDQENDSYGLVFKRIGEMEWSIVRRYLSLAEVGR